jgi:DUF2934 family protein
MPRPKSPKKNHSVEELASSSTTVPVANSDNESPRTFAVQPATAETRKTEMKTATPKKARKPAIVKAEPRSKLVPINLEDEIRRLAYLLSERRGFEPGHETEDWVMAEREIRERYHQQSA